MFIHKVQRAASGTQSSDKKAINSQNFKIWLEDYILNIFQCFNDWHMVESTGWKQLEKSSENDQPDPVAWVLLSSVFGLSRRTCAGSRTFQPSGQP